VRLSGVRGSGASSAVGIDHHGAAMATSQGNKRFDTRLIGLSPLHCDKDVVWGAVPADIDDNRQVSGARGLWHLDCHLVETCKTGAQCGSKDLRSHTVYETLTGSCTVPACAASWRDTISGLVGQIRCPKTPGRLPRGRNRGQAWEEPALARYL